MKQQSFNNVIVTGRGGSGKSEFIDFLKQINVKERLEKFHIGEFKEIDDFPWLYSMFKDEDIWESLGKPRKLAERTEKIYVTKDYDVYDLMTLRFNLELKKRINADPHLYKETTIFIEFARGRENAYKTAFNLLDNGILKRSAIFFLDNTFEESMRRNTVRSKESDSKQTILHHKVPVEVMEYYYKVHDWKEITEGKPSGYIGVRGIKIPFVTVWNMPESQDFKVLEERYSSALKKLWELYCDR